MKVMVTGTKTFSNYNVFLRAMRVVLSDLNNAGDTELVVYSAGPSTVNDFSREFLNITENSLKSLGVSTKLIVKPFDTMKQIVTDMDYVASFTSPDENKGVIASIAEDNNIEWGVFRH